PAPHRRRRFLYGGLDERLLRVNAWKIEWNDTYERTEYLLTDPYVGTFRVTFLAPGERRAVSRDSRVAGTRL
ncbi:MAG: hypothetical protein M5R36_16000, partial [Deltaproteobacteria bacterium]|nr:hypothetical protein [Deltaproteobacteria bacterium]